MNFLYYFPGKDAAQITPEFLEGVGLGDVARDCLRRGKFDERVARNNVHSRGPDGSSGALVALCPINGENPEASYHPDQEWTAIRHRPGADGTEGTIRYWLGFNPNNPPRPETIRRDRMTAGYDYELGDGQLWTCPVIRRPSGLPNVPTEWGCGPEGGFASRVMDEYAEMWTLSGLMLRVCFGLLDWTPAQTFAASVRCLALNYRVGAHEVSALKLLNSANYHRVFKAAVDGEALQAFFTSPQGLEMMREMFPDDAEHEPLKKSGESSDSPLSGTSSTPGQPVA